VGLCSGEEQVKNKLEMMWQETVMAYFEVLSRNLSADTK
jgi:hypothetical protein